MSRFSWHEKASRDQLGVFLYQVQVVQIRVLPEVFSAAEAGKPLSATMMFFVMPLSVPRVLDSGTIDLQMLVICKGGHATTITEDIGSVKVRGITYC
jgi:hypothetical protein